MQKLCLLRQNFRIKQFLILFYRIAICHARKLPKKVPRYFISSVTGTGVQELKDGLWDALNSEV